MADSVEEKVIDKIRKVLIADSTINDYVNKRVYDGHPTTITQPEFPAISLFLLNSEEDFSAPDTVLLSIQIDIWLNYNDYSTLDLYKIKNRLRVLLHRGDLTDTDIGVTFMNISELPGSAVMFEEDTNLYHLAARYQVRAI